MHATEAARGEVVLEGRGLHTGSAVRVILRKRTGPVVFLTEGEVPLTDARGVKTERATTIAVGRLPLAPVELLLAAFGGLGVHRGVSIEVVGSELPLLDGGARVFCEALHQLGVTKRRGPLEVAHEGRVSVGDSSYLFQRG